MPTSYGYCRVSTDRQVASGLSLETQQADVAAYQAYLKSTKNITPGAIFTEPDGVSAYKTPFIKRDAGARLNSTVRAGDHIVIHKHDRAFRNLSDMVTTVTRWKAVGVTIHFQNLNIDCNTPMGELILNIMVSLSQWESRIKGERQVDANRAKRMRRSPTLSKPIKHKIRPAYLDGQGLVHIHPSVKYGRYISWLNNWLKKDPSRVPLEYCGRKTDAMRSSLQARINYITQCLENCLAKRERRQPKRFNNVKLRFPQRAIRYVLESGNRNVYDWNKAQCAAVKLQNDVIRDICKRHNMTPDEAIKAGYLDPAWTLPVPRSGKLPPHRSPIQP